MRILLISIILFISCNSDKPNSVVNDKNSDNSSGALKTSNVDSTSNIDLGIHQYTNKLIGWWETKDVTYPNGKKFNVPKERKRYYYFGVDKKYGAGHDEPVDSLVDWTYTYKISYIKDTIKAYHHSISSYKPFDNFINYEIISLSDSILTFRELKNNWVYTLTKIGLGRSAAYEEFKEMLSQEPINQAFLADKYETERIYWMNNRKVDFERFRKIRKDKLKAYNDKFSTFGIVEVRLILTRIPVGVGALMVTFKDGVNYLISVTDQNKSLKILDIENFGK